MQIISGTSEIMASLLDAVIILYFLNKFFEKKENNKVAVQIVVGILLFVDGQFLQDYLTIQTTLYIAIMIGYSIFFLEGKKIYKIFTGVSIVLALSIINIVTLEITSLATGQEISSLIKAESIERIIFLAMSKLMLFFTAYLIVHKVSKTIRLKRDEWVLIVIYFISTMCVSIVLLDVIASIDMNTLLQIKILVAAFLIIAITVASFSMVGKINRQNQYEIINHMLNLQIKDQKESVIKVQKQYEETRKLKHDLNRHLNVLLELLREDRQNEAINQIEKLINSRSDSNVVYIKDNRIINAVINEKIDICREYCIDIKIKITASTSSDKELDIAVMLSNLLDNAIEAELRIDDKKEIEVSIFEYKQRYNIIIKNRITESVLSESKRLKTKKKDKENHGIGLISVKDTVEKYDGIFAYTEENNQFIVSVML